ncbi:MAG: hypothetical protein HQM11_15645 [SAR324 cluster bacterium]|nr:hypothetical protein [SAR324 cluster bacterium]
MNLVDLLLAAEKKASLVQDFVKLIDAEVEAKKGLGGMAIKTVYKLANSVNANLVPEALNNLLPEFIQALNPFYEKFKQTQEQSFTAFIQNKANEVTNALLSVTDQRAARTHHKTLKAGYEKLRSTAETQVNTALPKVAGIIEKYIK